MSCRICKNILKIVEVNLCQGCVDDLSEDNVGLSMGKRKMIEKSKKAKQQKKQVKKMEVKKNPSDLNKNREMALQDDNSTNSNESETDSKTICETFLLDHKYLSEKEKRFYSYLLGEKSLQIKEKHFIAQKIEVNSFILKQSEELLKQRITKLSLSDNHILDLLFHIENSSFVTVFFHAKFLSEMFFKNSVRLKESYKQVSQTEAVINIASNFKKGRMLSKEGKSYFIMKSEVINRSLFSIISFRNKKEEVKSVNFPELILLSLKDQDIYKLLLGLSQAKNCQSDENGICCRATIVGKLIMSRDVQKVVISKEQYSSSLSDTLQKLKIKGLQYEIQGNEMRD